MHGRLPIVRRGVSTSEVSAIVAFALATRSTRLSLTNRSGLSYTTSVWARMGLEAIYEEVGLGEIDTLPRLRTVPTHSLRSMEILSTFFAIVLLVEPRGALAASNHVPSKVLVAQTGPRMHRGDAPTFVVGIGTRVTEATSLGQQWDYSPCA